MEFEHYVILLIIGFIGLFSLIFVMRLLPKSTTKKQIIAKRVNNDLSLTELLEEQKKTYDVVMDSQAKQIKKLTGTVNRYKGIEDKNLAELEEETKEEEYDTSNLQEKYDVDVSKASALLKTMNLNIPIIDNILKDSSGLKNLLSNPLTSGMVWKQIEKNIDMIMPTGILVPKGQLPQQQSGDTTNKNESSKQTKYPTNSLGQDLGTA